MHTQAYLASPEVVAASAIAGHITGPEPLLADASSSGLRVSISTHVSPHKASADERMLDGFPPRVQGRVVLCADDNINTDGIYPGKYTYREDIDAATQAKVLPIVLLCVRVRACACVCVRVCLCLCA